MDVRRPIPVLSWCIGLTAVLAGLAAVGHGGLAAPDPVAPSSWSAWVDGRTSAEAVMALVRVVALAFAAYLALVTVLAYVLRAVRAGRLVRLLDVVTLPFVRSLVQAGFGAGMVVTTAVVVASPVAASPAPAASSAAVRPDPVPSPPPILQKLGPGAAAAPAGDGRTWTVASGEHLWSIASRVLAESWSRAPADRELAPFWEQLVDANRDRLADPANPDLLFPGQELVVPPPPPPP